MALVINLADMKAAEACELNSFRNSPRYVADNDGGKLVYPNGFDEREVDRLARSAPRALLWLVSKGLVPVSRETAKAAIAYYHPDGIEPAARPSPPGRGFFNLPQNPPQNPTPNPNPEGSQS